MCRNCCGIGCIRQRQKYYKFSSFLCMLYKGYRLIEPFLLRSACHFRIGTPNCQVMFLHVDA